MMDANLEDPKGKNIEEEEHVPVSSYRLIEPPPGELDEKSGGGGVFKSAEVKEEAKVQQPASEAPAPRPPSQDSLTARMQRFVENPTKFYATIGVGLGVLLGVILAIFLLTGSPGEWYDLGPVTASATGLKGHLYISWEKTLHYRMTFEASDAELQAGFAYVVANPPRPLFIEIQLQDTEGSVLCYRQIVLKYDTQSAAATADNLPNKPPVAVDPAQLKAEEQEREQGRDVFENQITPDGQVAILNAQGEIPCSKKAYEKTRQWNFSANFPTIAEQDELLERGKKMLTNAAEKSATHKSVARRAAVKLLPFSIEGDDAIVEFDINRGVIVTSGRKTFFLDKTSMGRADPVWQEYPVNIHFRCDQSTNCTLMHSGAGALHVKLKR
jgi:hypothetical protein